jgi:signal transduction histidine kinase
MKKVLDVLLVEDDFQDVEILREMLNFSFERACNLQVSSMLSEAISASELYNYDIILTDLGLPDCFGLETFIKLNDANPTTPIIVLTGLNDDQTGVEAVQNGAQDYLIKGDFQGEMLNRSILYAIERKRAKDELEASEAKYKEISAQLMEANNIKELLLDIITHDLKNNIGGIHGLSNILLLRSPEDEIAGNILDAAERLTMVIESATTLAKISCKEEIEKMNLDLQKIINEVIEEFAMMTEAYQMNVECNSNLSGQIVANPIIAEVFKNYFSNAIKYASEGRKIFIDIESDSMNVVIRISDMGKIIPEEDREKIFERRIQLQGNKGNGSGLGLAIVKSIAEMHEGRVWVEPYENLGNSFCIELPRN